MADLPSVPRQDSGCEWITAVARRIEGITTRASLRARPTRSQVTRINPSALTVAARRPWMAGSGFADVQVPPILRDLGE